MIPFPKAVQWVIPLIVACFCSWEQQEYCNMPSPARRTTRLLIIGSGPAGYTAALYAARANRQPLLVTGITVGGQLTTTTAVENWPGEAEAVQGPALMERFAKQIAHLGVETIQDEIHKAELDNTPFLLHGAEAVYACEALIIATGASAKYLGLPSEQEYMGRGVSACATCDGFFFRNQDVAVVGGGNTAAEEAMYLANICRHVTLIHRRDQLRAEPILAERLLRLQKEGKVTILWNSVVEEIRGDQSGVTGARLRNTKDGRESTLDVQGVFIAIGHTPNTGIFEGQLDMDQGYLRTGHIQHLHGAHLATATSRKGVFAAGDVADPIYRQACTAAGMGCMAAIDADRYLSTNSPQG
jgi:thioredoxin reductase (NADPH)